MRGDTETQRTVILQARHITKRFPGVLALDDVSITVHVGEVLALVGENGAGKSTFVNLLCGVYQPDNGEIRLNGERVAFRDPHHARRLGVDVVHQELSLLGELTVAENIMLGHEPISAGRIISSTELYRRAGEALRGVSAEIDLNALTSALTPAERQMVEIAKAVSFQPRVLMLDEPTSSLSKVEVDRLFEVIERLKKQGVGIIFISHRMDELFQFADQAVVLKDGRLVTTLPMSGTNREELIRLMVGREMRQTFPERPIRTNIEAANTTLLELKDVSFEDKLSGIDLCLRAGEIVGIGGLEGQGQRELVRGLFGIKPFDGGQVILDGSVVKISSPEDAIRQGIAFIPDDRKAEGLVLPLSVRENMSLASLSFRQRLGFVCSREEQARVAGYIRSLKIKVSSEFQLVKFLSGGNQQKVVFGKWLLTMPRLLILHEPTRGIDVQTKSEIYHLLRQMADRGVGILAVTSDMLELIGLSDRISVMYEGRIAGNVPAAGATEEILMTLGSGQELPRERGKPV